MDFFDILRQGCAFGHAKRSKNVKMHAPVAGVDEPEESRKAATSLDFFGNDVGRASTAAAKRQGEPQPQGETSSKRRKKGAAETPAPAAAAQVTAKPASQASAEAVIALRKKHRIRASAGVPDPMATFETMAERGVPKWLIQNMQKLGFEEPTAIQMQCFPAVLTGSHMLASAPTGSGKTIAFLGPLLAILEKPGKEFARVLVLDPTRELAKQTLDEFVKLTQGRKWSARVLDKISGNKAQELKRLDVAISTPLRLASVLREGRISLDRMKHMVLDEADKVLDMGFAPQVDEIMSYCPRGSQGGMVQTLMFSATLPPAVCDLAGSILTSPFRVSIGDVNAAAPDVDQKLLFITHEDGKLFTFRQLVQEGQVKPPALLFVQSKDRAQQLFGELVYDGIFVDVIHADRTQHQRDNTVKAFRSGKIWMLICTDLMARGIDFKGVETVINFDFPQSASTYIHRIGRTGRAGRGGRAITFFTIADFDSLRSIVSVMRQSGCEIPEWTLRLKQRSKKEKRLAEWRTPSRKDIDTSVPRWKLEVTKRHMRRRGGPPADASATNAE